METAGLLLSRCVRTAYPGFWALISAQVIPAEKLRPHLHEDTAMVLAQHCEHVLQIFASFLLPAHSVVGERLVVVMELAPHGDLSQAINSRWAGSFWAPRPTSSQLLDMARQLTCGLKNLHGRSLMHRDIKPLNVLVFDEGILKHADLGLSKQMDPSVSSRIHTRGLGTIWYVAPEVAAGLYSARADLYSLGCMLAEIDFDNILPVFFMQYKERMKTTDSKAYKMLENLAPSAYDEMFKNLVIDIATQQAARRCPLLGVIIDILVRRESRTRASLEDVLAMLDVGEVRWLVV